MSTRIWTDLGLASGPLSEEGLKCLKTYKYSSVDKSLISHYLLRHYVLLPRALCSLADPLIFLEVECICRGLAPVAGSQHGDTPRLLLHFDQRRVS